MMNKVFSIYDGYHAVELKLISGREMDRYYANPVNSIPIYYSSDGRVFPLPTLRTVIAKEIDMCINSMNSGDKCTPKSNINKRDVLQLKRLDMLYKHKNELLIDIKNIDNAINRILES